MLIKLANRILVGTALSCTFSVTLALIFAAGASGHFSLNTFQLPGVLPVALIGSVFFSIVMTPFAVWALRTGMKNLRVYGPILWIALALYVVLVIPRIGRYGLLGLLLLGLAGVVILGLIPAAD